jgi:hypothetical protein
MRSSTITAGMAERESMSRQLSVLARAAPTKYAMAMPEVVAIWKVTSIEPLTLTGADSAM